MQSYPSENRGLFSWVTDICRTCCVPRQHHDHPSRNSEVQHHLFTFQACSNRPDVCHGNDHVDDNQRSCPGAQGTQPTAVDRGEKQGSPMSTPHISCITSPSRNSGTLADNRTNYEMSNLESRSNHKSACSTIDEREAWSWESGASEIWRKGNLSLGLTSTNAVDGVEQKRFDTIKSAPSVEGQAPNVENFTPMAGQTRQILEKQNSGIPEAENPNQKRQEVFAATGSKLRGRSSRNMASDEVRVHDANGRVGANQSTKDLHMHSNLATPGALVLRSDQISANYKKLRAEAPDFQPSKVIGIQTTGHHHDETGIKHWEEQNPDALKGFQTKLTEGIQNFDGVDDYQAGGAVRKNVFCVGHFPAAQQADKHAVDAREGTNSPALNTTTTDHFSTHVSEMDPEEKLYLGYYISP